MENLPERPFKRHEAIRFVLLLAGSITIGVIVAIGLHEIGHVLTLWYFGHSIKGFYLNPYYISWVRSDPIFIDYVSAGGFFFSPTFSLIVWFIIILRKKRKAWAVWLSGIIAITALFSNGVYMASDAIWGYYGDAAKLVHQGNFAVWIMLAIGTLYIGIGYLLAGQLFRHAGLHHIPMTTTIFLLETALFTYTIPNEIYDYAIHVNGKNFTTTFASILIPAIMAHLVPFIARVKKLRWKDDTEDAFWKISWKQSIFIFHGGLVSMVLVLLFFGKPY